jgi:hypothetical protein
VGTSDKEQPQAQATPRRVAPAAPAGTFKPPAAAQAPGQRAATPPGQRSASPPAAAQQQAPRQGQRQGQGQRQESSGTGEIQAGLREGVGAVLQDTVLGRHPYLKMAFANPFNLSLVGGGLAAALLTANPLLALGTLGLEALWLLHAPDSQRLRHILWDPRFDRLKKALDAQERARRMAGLPDDARERVETLVARQDEIHRLAAGNPTFAGDLLKDELVKTDRLVDAFVEMALTCARYESYLAAIDPAALERERKRYEQAIQSAGDDTAQSGIAKRNLAVVTKRVEKLQEIRRYLTVARGQLDLIENSFQLIADQIVTMQSPQELSGQLDELLDGVEAVRESSRETEQLLAGIEHTL